MIMFDLRKKGFVGRVRIVRPTGPEIAAAIVFAMAALGAVWLMVR